MIDQNLSRSLPSLLVAAGFDVADTRTLGMQRWTDEDIADFAAAENRIVVSADTDFGAILAKRQAVKPSFVLLRRTQGLSPEAVAGLLAINLPPFEDDLNEGAILVVTDTVIRARRLPISPV
ncbi:MAG: DUF5615 family PIN-like protein [Micropruina sp.]|uniref:DUF5615 family PIN-like protein n=1 Tax=Micropruina sp. TaxID=2737536 RepID=UPI0039E4B8C7